MMDFETIGWKLFDELGCGTGRESKVHLLREGTLKTLCGAKIPNKFDADIAVDHGYGECKRCASIAKKLELQAKPKNHTTDRHPVGTSRKPSQGDWGVRDHRRDWKGFTEEDAHTEALRLSTTNPDVVYEVMQGTRILFSYLAGNKSATT